MLRSVGVLFRRVVAPQRCFSQFRLAGESAPEEISLNNLRDNDGSRRIKRRLGRGIGSSKGKTSGKGHKGSKPRTQQPNPGFEGGQSPLKLRIPKHGFTNKKFKIDYETLNLGKLQLWIDQGRIDASRKITMKELRDSGCVGRILPNKQGVKLLAEVR
jgi:large subunit ribosomal protein L15